MTEREHGFSLLATLSFRDGTRQKWREVFRLRQGYGGHDDTLALQELYLESSLFVILQQIQGGQQIPSETNLRASLNLLEAILSFHKT